MASETVRADIFAKLEAASLSNGYANDECSTEFSRLDSLLNYKKQLEISITSIVSDDSINNIINFISFKEFSEQESFLQKTLTSFTDHLEKKYPSYRDIVQPVSLAIYQLKYGMRMIQTATSDSLFNCHTQNLHDSLFKQLLNFSVTPLKFNHDEFSTLSNSILSFLATKSNPKLKLDAIIALLLQFLSHIHSRATINSHEIGVMQFLFSTMIDLWNEAQRNILEAEVEADEFYKYKTKTHSIVSDELQDELDLQIQFPDFYNEFNDLTNDNSFDQDPPESTSVYNAKIDSISIDFDELSETALMIHKDFIHCYKASGSDVLSYIARHQALWTDSFVKSYRLVSDICKIEKSKISLCYEKSILDANLFMSSFRFESLNNPEYKLKSVSMNSTYDFYRDQNVNECLKVESILSNFDRRISELLENWPEHSVLNQLATICRRIASFPLTSPIMKVLSGLEILLQKCQDWESYASHQFSIQNLMNQLTEQIIQWRHLELSSWKELLSIEDRNAKRKTSKHWFYLFQIICKWIWNDGESVIYVFWINIYIKVPLIINFRMLIRICLKNFYLRLTNFAFLQILVNFNLD